MRVLRFDALLVGDGTSLLDGALICDGDAIVEVGPARELLPRAGGLPVTVHRGVALPGLVNAHTHLELSGLRGKTAPGQGFVPWLESMQAARVGELEEEREAAISAAIDALVSFGVVAVGEVTNGLSAVPALGRRLLGTVFHEVFGMDREVGLRALAETPTIPSTLRYARAPHALYSTHPDVVRTIAETASPLSMHLSEHAPERAFLETGGGPFAAFLDRRGVPRGAFPIPGQSPIAYADALGLLRPDAAMVHLSDAREPELDLFAARGAIAVLCPRSNLFIDTRYPPIHALLARGIPLALGTDSLASNTTLDPLADARALFDKPSVPAATLIAAATSGGARAIGHGDSLGRLRPRTRPGILLVEGTLGDADPARFVLQDLSRPRRMLAAAGKADP